MKSISKFLTLLLCFELIVAPFGTKVGVMNHHANAESCPAGQVFKNGHCQISDQNAQMINTTLNCGDENSCYMENAINEFEKQKDGNDYSGNAKINQSIVRSIGISAALGMTFEMAAQTSFGLYC